MMRIGPDESFKKYNQCKKCKHIQPAWQDICQECGSTKINTIVARARYTSTGGFFYPSYRLTGYEVAHD